MNKVGIVVVATINNQTSRKRGINPPTKNVIYPHTHTHTNQSNHPAASEPREKKSDH